MPLLGTLGSKTVPLYGGGQVRNPANVVVLNAAPSASAIGNPVGSIAVNQVSGTAYMAVKNTGISGTVTWAVLGGSTAAVDTINANAPVAGNYTLAGTANQITATDTAGTTTFSIPAAFVAPGSIAATVGNITATNGNLVLGTAGNKLSIATGANASVGTATLAGTPGTIVVATTAVTANSIILISRNTPGGTLGNLSVPSASIIAGTSFVIDSDANDESTVNWMIIN